MRKILCASLVTIACVGVTPRAAQAQLEVLTPSIMERASVAGATYMLTIVLRNAATTAQTARVYQEDYRFFADGRSLFGRAAAHSRSNAEWISTPSNQITLRPGETVQLPISVAVPNDSISRVGSFWSLILIEPVSTTSSNAADRQTPAGTSAILTRVRQAIQVVTHIAETGRHDVRIGEPRLVTNARGQREVRVEIENTGERAYRPQVSLEILAANGNTVFSHKQARGLIYPGTSIDQVFDLASLRSDDYALLLVVDTGSADMFGARYRLRLQ